MADKQVNFRLDDHYFKKLEDAAGAEGVKTSAVAQDMVKKALDFWWKKQKRQDIPIPVSIMRIYMDNIDIKKMKADDLESISDFMYSEMLSQVNPLSFEEMTTRIKKFNEKIGVSLGVFPEKEDEEGMERIKFFAHSALGRNWNHIQAELYSRLFMKMDIQIISKKSDATGYTIIVKKTAD